MRLKRLEMIGFKSFAQRTVVEMNPGITAVVGPNGCGKSEYAINKVPCRLKDVIELFLGTGVGSKAYSIVEQGKVDELVNAKPEDRRALIEEAAGTSKYKSRKLVAERKLERTQQNLLRVTDIVREMERQIRAMELQAKKAERYRALKTELRQKDLLWASLQRQ